MCSVISCYINQFKSRASPCLESVNYESRKVRHISEAGLYLKNNVTAFGNDTANSVDPDKQGFCGNSSGYTVFL